MELSKVRAEIASTKNFIRDARVVLFTHAVSDACEYHGLLSVVDHLLAAAERECQNAAESLKD